MNGTVPVMVLSEQEGDTKLRAGARGLGAHVVEMSLDALKDGLARTAGAVMTALDALPPNDNYQVEDVTLTLTIDATGTISIVGAVTGELEASSALTLTICRKGE